jgi:hypothetical protein
VALAAAGLGDSTGLAAQIGQGAAGGAIIGTLQWVVLSAQVCAARWWVVVSVADWATGAAAGDGVAYYAGDPGLVISPVVAAAVTGIAVAAIRRCHDQDAHPASPELSSPKARRGAGDVSHNPVDMAGRH